MHDTPSTPATTKGEHEIPSVLDRETAEALLEVLSCSDTRDFDHEPTPYERKWLRLSE